MLVRLTDICCRITRFGYQGKKGVKKWLNLNGRFWLKTIDRSHSGKRFLIYDGVY
jgi:hypothetical protein